MPLRHALRQDPPPLGHDPDGQREVSLIRRPPLVDGRQHRPQVLVDRVEHQMDSLARQRRAPDDAHDLGDDWVRRRRHQDVT